MCDWFADRVIALSGKGEPFLAGMLTLSSHRPFDVPFSKFDDKELNAFAFSDECVGRMVDKLKASPAWDNLLLVLVADHGYPWPRSLSYNEPLRHRIPMIWLGGAVAAPRVVDTYASQIDICATILGQLGIDHSDFDYSKDIFVPTPPRKFAYYTFNDGFGVVDASGEAVWDATSGKAVSETAPGLLDIGRTMLQTTYVDIGNR
jgi:phosphoglycerol transferase MdoB-like AlkP superfamily enzyme